MPSNITTDLNTASTLFSSMLISDPFRLDFLDHYSNILHTLSSHSQLAFVTHPSTSISLYRPETHIAIGNYYSLTHRHTDAIQSFRLALHLDRNFAAAWTPLGHEYCKLENTHAAIEAYRRAVEGNNKDYRAFVRLGVVYEGLEKRSFALHYYRRAVALRPGDGDMWGLMGGCLMGMERAEQAIEALKRGIVCNDYGIGDELGDAFHAKCRRLEMMFQLAKAYEKVRDRLEATKCLESCLDEFDKKEYPENSVDPLRVKVILIVEQARLLLTQWTAAGGDDLSG
ncbi:hypothetical protein V493_00669 [Pseudogymnoascus sp. VKM F-4281 (FW-2241)]|nr:hypothetical protein V493_00669 [Pseudogymnoascus sp. VKM F-4281 (FW-2241)]